MVELDLTKALVGILILSSSILWGGAVVKVRWKTRSCVVHAGFSRAGTILVSNGVCCLFLQL
jgi:hypothetical protein